MTVAITSNTKKLLSKVLLVFYISNLFFLSFEASHTHNQEKPKCNQSHHLVNDACHLKLEHHDTVNGCKHSEHFLPASHRCSLCELILHFDIAIIGEQKFQLPDSDKKNTTPVKLIYPSKPTLNLRNKSPPTPLFV